MTSLETATDAPSRAAQRKNAANTGAKPRARSGKRKPGADLYTEVTAKIVKELEAGRFPWAQPWAARGEAATIAAGLPKNATTGRRNKRMAADVHDVRPGFAMGRQVAGWRQQHGRRQ